MGWFPHFIIPCSLFLVHHSFVLSVGVLADRTIKDSSRRQALSDREFKSWDGSLTSSFRVPYSLFTILLSYRSVSSPTAQLKILPDDKHCQTENLNYGMVLSLHHSVFNIPCSLFFLHHSVFFIPCSLFFLHHSLFNIQYHLFSLLCGKFICKPSKKILSTPK
jgi:hypothetical protein